MRPSDGTAAASATRARRRWLWPLRLLVRLVVVLLVVTTALAAGAVCFALFPPADLLRRAALPLAQKILKHPNLHLGALELTPRDGLELRDLWLGPPAGYRLPLLTIRRITVRYDLSRIGQGELHLRNVLVERPVIRVESRGGKLSWLAFLEGLPKSQPKPDEPSEPSTLALWLHRVSVVGLAAYLDDGRNRASVDGLSVALSGLYSPSRARLDLALRFEPRSPGRSNLGLLARGLAGAEELGARFLNRLALDVTLDGKPPAPGSSELRPLRAELGLDLDLGSQELRSPWVKEPLRLRLALRAKGDLPKDRAELERLTLTLNEDELCRVAAALEGLKVPRAARLRLESLSLPLARLLPYARGFLPGIDAGGMVRVRGLEVSGPIAVVRPERTEQRTAEELRGQGARLPQVSGTVAFERVWARVKRGAQRAELRDLDLALVFASRREGQTLVRSLAELLGALPPLARSPGVEALTGAARAAPVAAQGRIRVGLARGAGAELRGLELRLGAGVDLAGLRPAAVASRLQLDAGALRYHHPKLGPLELGLKTRVLGGADLAARRALLESLELSLDDLLSLSLRARAEEFGRKSFSAELDLRPLELSRLLARVPRGLRGQVAGLKLGGRVGLKLRARGRTPAPRTPPLRLPIELDARVALEGIGLEDRARALALSKLGGTLAIQGRPSDLRITSDLRIAELRKPDQALRVEGLALPLSLRVVADGAPARGGRDFRVEGTVGLAAGRVRKADAGLGLRGLTLETKLGVRLPLEGLVAGRRVALGSSQLRTTVGLESARLSGGALTLGKLATEVAVSYTPGQPEPTQVVVKTRIDALQHAPQAVKVQGIGLELATRVASPSLSIPPRPEELQLKRASTRLGLDLASVSKRGVLDQPLRGNRVDLDASLTPDGALELRKLALRAPTRGVRLDLSGSASGLRTIGLGPLPPFDLTLRAGLDNPPARERQRAVSLAPNLRSAGKIELELRTRRTSAYRVQLDGRLHAKAFSLWLRSLASEPQPEGGLLRKETVIYAKEMNADVPIRQQLIVKLPSGVSLPPPRASVLDAGAATALFSALQPYLGGRSRLALGGVSLDEKLTSVSREGYFLGSSKRRFVIDRLALDLALADSTLRLSRMYLKLFGGDVAGQVLAQLASQRPLDVKAVFRTQVTGVNLAYLDTAAKERSAKTEVSALVDVRFWMRKGLIEGRVDITRLSLDMLDALLAYLDPNRTNESVQKNRKLINSWLVKRINPKVKLVSIWITHGNLNMDIEMDAWFVAGAILKRTLKNMQIRRINILPLLPKGIFREEAAP
jgi:hypothetical protein